MSATRTNLTQKQLDAIKPGDRQADYPDVAVRGLALRVSPGGAMTWVLIKRLRDVGVRRIRLGRYVKGAASLYVAAQRTGFPTGMESLSLQQAREEANRVLALIHAGHDPVTERAVAKHLHAVASERGSLEDLLRDYIAWRKAGSESRAPVSPRQVAEWSRLVDTLKRRAAPLLAMKAQNVEPAHVVALLRPIYHKGTARPSSGRGSKGRVAANGAQGAAAKVQSFLRAAFVYGIQSENSVARTVPRTYGIKHNPVANIPRESKSTPGERALSHSELRQFWLTIDKVAGVGQVMADLLRFTIASGGQRTHQLAREPWSSYDTAKRVVSLIDRKGRGGQPRAHLVPMTERMAKILVRVHAISGGRTWPWSTSPGKPIDIASPASAVRKWLASEHAAINGKRVEPFSPRDLRRTCTQLMQAQGIPEDQSDRLQSHGVAGVTGKHYRNNPELYLPEKRQALEALDRALRRILSGKW